MTLTDRERLLEELASAFNRGANWWGGMSISEIARILSFNDLPDDLQGRLIMALTPGGFSVAEANTIDKKLKNLQSESDH